MNENLMRSSDYLSPAEWDIIYGRLWELLKSQARSFAGCDSTSITVDRARDLLESMMFTLSELVEAEGSPRDLLEEDLGKMIRRGQSLLENRRKSACVDWKLLAADLPDDRNVYYRSTVKSLGRFFERYDIYYRAHAIPCSIDYWLMSPVDESLKGIRYIEEYLRRLQLENDFLHCFDPEKRTALYRRLYGHYEEMFFNLCEPVLEHAVALEILGEDPMELTLSESQTAELRSRLRAHACDPEEATRSLLLRLHMADWGQVPICLNRFIF